VKRLPLTAQYRLPPFPIWTACLQSRLQFV
jgi:hypothetical protein